MSEQVKCCSKCGDTKPIAEFSKDAQKRDGLTSACKVCNKIAGAAWRVANPEKSKAFSAAWHAKNIEKHKVLNAKWYEKNSEKVKASATKNREANPEKYKACSAKWSASNRDKKIVYWQNRRARISANGDNLSKDIVKKLFRLQRGKCVCCGEPLGTDYHLDHIMPIALGGSNTDDNVQLLTSRCNHQKYIKHPIQFMQERGFLL